MVGVPRLSEEELRVRDERQREWRKQYNAKPEVKEYQKEWHKKDNQTPWTKEAHRISQARYRNTAKGKACDVRAWKKYNAKTRDNKEDSNDYPDIAV
jgi:hypothetical protein